MKVTCHKNVLPTAELMCFIIRRESLHSPFIMQMRQATIWFNDVIWFKYMRQYVTQSMERIYQVAWMLFSKNDPFYLLFREVDLLNCLSMVAILDFCAIFTPRHFSRRGYVIASVCPSVRPLLACLRDNSSSI